MIGDSRAPSQGFLQGGGEPQRVPYRQEGDSLPDLVPSRPWLASGQALPAPPPWALQQPPGTGWKTGNDIICLIRIFTPAPPSNLFFPISQLLPSVRKGRKSRGAGKEIEGYLPLSPPAPSEKSWTNHFPATKSRTNSD